MYISAQRTRDCCKQHVPDCLPPRPWILCYSDEEEDTEEVAGLLIDALVEANGLELLVQRLAKLNESVDEEAQAVNHALAVIEHAVEVGADHLGCSLQWGLQGSVWITWMMT